MNRKAMVVVVLLGLVLSPKAHAQDRAVGEIVEEIKQAQGVERAEAIDPDQVSDATLAELGEALMSVMMPNERQHEFMDSMMGGEGSESLEAMHRSMGYSYLSGDGPRGWDRRLWDRGWGGMMGPGMMGPGGAWSPGMMGSRWNRGGMHGWGGGAWVWVLVAVLSIAVIVLVALLIARGRRSSSGGRVSGGAREILAERYARGEITREQYEEVKRDLDR